MDKAHRETDAVLEKIEKKLTEIYTRADKEIRAEWDKYLDKFKDKAAKLQKAILNAEGEEREKAEKAYKDFLRNSVYKTSRYKRMVEQTAEQLTNVNKTAVAYINGELPPIYSLNYNAIAGDMDGLRGISFELVDQHTVKNLATKDKTLLPYKQVNGKKDERWNTKRINAEVIQGILQGESIPKIAKRLKAVEDMNRDSAIRNARTMVTSAENKGRIDMLETADKNGIVTKKKWLSAHDNRTRDAHRLLNGQTKERDEKFVVTVIEGKKHPHVVTYTIEYPGDPNADPAMVYNCRCTLVYEVVGFRKANGDVVKISKKPTQAKKGEKM